MNPSYFRIRLPLEKAKKRLNDWWGVSQPQEPVKTDSTSAVRLACTESGVWRGGALYFYQSGDWAVFEDLSGGFSFTPASSWLAFAKQDSFVFAGYNDSIPYGELIAIEKGQVVREFVDLPDEPKEGRDAGKLVQEEERPIQGWIDVAAFIDEDELAFSEEGWLWLNEKSQEPVQEEASQLEVNLQRWINDGAPVRWVEDRRGKWTDHDWEQLVEELKATEYWPLDPDQVGEVLEQTTRQWESAR